MTPRRASQLVLGSLALALAQTARAQDWQPVAGAPTTKWTATVSPFLVWPEHPRPLLRRTNWCSLHGLWDYAITAATAPMPEHADGQILVPFAPGTTLSGVARTPAAGERLWYRRALPLPPRDADRFWLHLDGCHGDCEVWVNGHALGHFASATPIDCEITDALGRGRTHTLVVAVDPPLAEPAGDATAPCGLWQPVWIEGTSSTCVRAIAAHGDRTGKVRIDVETDGPTKDLVCTVRVFALARVVAQASAPLGQPFELTIPEPGAWSPANPFRYGLQVRLHSVDADHSASLDWVDSAFALRDVAVTNDAHGRVRMHQSEPLFLLGPRYDGIWPDGGRTPPSRAALQGDLDAIKRSGCTMVFVPQPQSSSFYIECELRGLVVLQVQGEQVLVVHSGHDLATAPRFTLANSLLAAVDLPAATDLDAGTAVLCRALESLRHAAAAGLAGAIVARVAATHDHLGLLTQDRARPAVDFHRIGIALRDLELHALRPPPAPAPRTGGR